MLKLLGAGISTRRLLRCSPRRAAALVRSARLPLGVSCRLTGALSEWRAGGASVTSGPEEGGAPDAGAEPELPDAGGAGDAGATETGDEDALWQEAWLASCVVASEPMYN